MEKNVEFAALLNAHLQEKDRSYSWLAERLKVKPSTVSRWGNAETRPRDSETIALIADHLGIYDRTERSKFAVAAGFVYYENLVEGESGVGSKSKMAQRINGMVSKGVDHLPDWIAMRIHEQFDVYRLDISPDADFVYPLWCGNKGIDLQQQRLLISTSFGTYFAGLLERDNIYQTITEQIDSPVIFGQIHLTPLERVLWSLEYRHGPSILVIAAEGGMGKSTLAAKIVRCLFERRVVDMILGDSAKVERLNPLTGKIIKIEPGYYDPISCVEILRTQLGLPVVRGRNDLKKDIAEIQDRLSDRRTVIVIDNMETVSGGEGLLQILYQLASWNVRVLITTRKMQGIHSLSHKTMVVHLNPVTDFESVVHFLSWHIRHFQVGYPALRALNLMQARFDDIARLIEKTGGIPLLMQLVISDVARSSWSYLAEMPNLFGLDLLNFLYGERWTELGKQGESGVLAKDILRLIAKEQMRGNQITFVGLLEYVKEKGDGKVHLQQALLLLYERFLVVNHDIEKGNFTIFPSLVDFLQHDLAASE